MNHRLLISITPIVNAANAMTMTTAKLTPSTTTVSPSQAFCPYSSSPVLSNTAAAVVMTASLLLSGGSSGPMLSVSSDTDDPDAMDVMQKCSRLKHYTHIYTVSPTAPHHAQLTLTISKQPIIEQPTLHFHYGDTHDSHIPVFPRWVGQMDRQTDRHHMDGFHFPPWTWPSHNYQLTFRTTCVVMTTTLSKLMVKLTAWCNWTLAFDISSQDIINNKAITDVTFRPSPLLPLVSHSE